MTQRPALFVVDTTVLSNLMLPNPDPGVARWVEDAPYGTLYLPSSAVFEVQLGIELAWRRGNLRAADIQYKFDAILDSGRYRILATGAGAAQIRAEMAADPALANFAARDPRSTRAAVGEEITIAAAAVWEGAAVATLNRRAFARIGSVYGRLKVFDPSAGDWVAFLKARPQKSRDRMAVNWHAGFPAGSPSPGEPDPSPSTGSCTAPAASGRRKLPDARSGGTYSAVSLHAVLSRRDGTSRFR